MTGTSVNARLAICDGRHTLQAPSVTRSSPECARHTEACHSLSLRSDVLLPVWKTPPFRWVALGGSPSHRSLRSHFLALKNRAKQNERAETETKAETSAKSCSGKTCIQTGRRSHDRDTGRRPAPAPLRRSPCVPTASRVPPARGGAALSVHLEPGIRVQTRCLVSWFHVFSLIITAYILFS